MVATLADLSQPERDVMEQLVQQRTTSVVSLAAALWRTTPDWEAFDPYPALLFILDELSERGLVKYRTEAGIQYGWKKDGALRTPRMAFDIHLTQDGWTVMGYPHRHVEVGTFKSGHGQRLDTPLQMRADMTNYRHHDDVARGGDIEKEDFATHREHYPHHIHDYGEDSTMSTHITENQPGRQYTRVTTEMEASVIAVRERDPLISHADIAERVGISPSTVKYILTDLPRIRRSQVPEDVAATSLKQRVLNLITDSHPMSIDSVKEMRSILGLADTEHDIVHVLHSLHTQGKVDFDERGNGMGTATYTNIRLHKRGAKPKVVVAHTEYDQPEPEDGMSSHLDEMTSPEGYPLLDDLLARERNRLDADNKGMSYVVAAEAIEKVDPDMARELMAKAEALNIPFPSPLEQEYLRYVAANPTGWMKDGPTDA